MKAYWKYLIIGAAIVVSAWLLARAYTYKYHAQETIVVTGLGETEFSSDLIVWNGFITAEAQNVEAGYAQIESSKKKVYDYLLSKGIAADAVVFQFVNVNKQYEPVYSANGSWAGQRFTGYRLSQGFTVESKSVDAVENVSREISSLIAQGVSIEAMQPDYYYTKLDDVKFRKKVVPGDTLLFRVELLAPVRHGISSMKGYMFVGDQVVAEATFTAQIVKNK